MKLPLGIANKLLQMLQDERLPASTLQHSIITKLLEDGVVQKQQTGKSKALLFVADATSLHAYIKNHFGINNLQEYVNKYNDEALTRADAITIAGDSKLKAIRTFKGFVVNTYQDIDATLNGKPFIIHPVNGAFTFISDYETFHLSPTVTIVGIENPENFRYIHLQQYLFQHIQPLFVSRYPHSNDLIKWLKSIPNPYLHFGDFDFAGMNIYLNEYKPHVEQRGSYFIPPNLEKLVDEYGNRNLYNTQFTRSNMPLNEPGLQLLSAVLHKYKKGLEQEVLINASEIAL